MLFEGYVDNKVMYSAERRTITRFWILELFQK